MRPPRRTRLPRSTDAIVALSLALVIGALLISALVAWLSVGSAAPAASSPSGPHRDLALRPTGAERSVVRRIDALQAAVGRGDVVALCAPGRMVTPAAVRAMDGLAGGCEEAVGTSLVNLRGDVHIAVRSVSLRPDLAVAQVVRTRGGAPADMRMTLLKDGRRWLLTFSDAGNPLLEVLR